MSDVVIPIDLAASTQASSRVAGSGAAARGLQAVRHPLAWTLLLMPALGWAALMTLLMLTHFLAQLYVWKFYPLLEALEGWLDVTRDRLVVALPIALLLVALGRLRLAGDAARAGLLAAVLAAMYWLWRSMANARDAAERETLR